MKTAELVWHDIKTEKPPMDVALLGCSRVPEFALDKKEGELFVGIIMLCSDWPDEDPKTSIDGFHLVTTGQLFDEPVEYWTEVREEIDICRTGS